MSTRTGQQTLIRSRDLELQQFAQGGGASLVESCSQCIFHGFQIGSAVVVPFGEYAAQQLVYFPRNLLMDCSSRFFPVRSIRPAAARQGEDRRSFR
jgi:hypothetical protein